MLSPKPILLIDMDGVVFDYYGMFLEVWQELYPKRSFILDKDLKEFYIENCYDSAFKEDILSIMQSKNFFRKIRPVEGAVKALTQILKSGTFDAFSLYGSGS